MFDYPERDWKTYRKKIGPWQENFMNKLNQEYIEILSSEKYPSEKFWELEERIYKDKKLTGVIVQNSRSMMFNNLINLYYEGAITLEDLNDFSKELQEDFKRFIKLEEKFMESDLDETDS